MQGHQITGKEALMPLHMMLEVSLSQAIDEYRWDSRTPTRTKAIKQLLRLGLESYQKQSGKKSK